ncbi:hypothetical protein [Roseivirga pacifica]
MRNLLTISLLLICATAFGQMGHAGRFEREYKWETDDFIVISNEENGVLLVQSEYKVKDGGFPVHFTLLNDKLELEWEETLDVAKDLFLKGFHYLDGKTFFLLQDRFNNHEVKIVIVDVVEKMIKEFEPKELTEMVVTKFQVIQNTAILGGYVEDRPVVFAYLLEDDKVNALSNVYQNNSEVLDIHINEDGVTFNVLATEKDEKKDQTITVNTYDYEGNAIRDYTLVTKQDYQLLSGVSTSIYNKEQMVFGLYGVKFGASPSGFYVNHVSRSGLQNMRYIPFGEMDEFFKHEGEKRSERFKKKSLAEKNGGKPFRYKIDVLFEEIIEEKDRVLLLGEFYRPWNRSTADMRELRRMDPAWYNRNAATINAGNRTRVEREMESTYDDYKFTHAYAISLGKNGQIQWDKAFELDENIDGELQSFGEFVLSNGEVYFAFYDDEEFTFQHLTANEEKEPQVEALNLMNENEELRNEDDDFRGITKWNDKYLVWGIQSVKTLDPAEPNRKVFFINAVTVGPNFKPADID